MSTESKLIILLDLFDCTIYSTILLKLGVLALSWEYCLTPVILLLTTERLGHRDVGGLSATDPRPRQ